MYQNELTDRSTFYIVYFYPSQLYFCSSSVKFQKFKSSNDEKQTFTFLKQSLWLFLEFKNTSTNSEYL